MERSGSLHTGFSDGITFANSLDPGETPSNSRLHTINVKSDRTGSDQIKKRQINMLQYCISTTSEIVTDAEYFNLTVNY